MASIRTRPWSFPLALAFAQTLAAVPAAELGQERVVDLELVLAVDVSSSVSADEFELQIRGLAEAFSDSRVTQAIRASGDLGLAVALIQWSDNHKQFLAVDWTIVYDAESAEALSEEIVSTPRFLNGGGTAIGSALEYAIRQLEINDFEGRRKVIDVSGDGRTNQGVDPAHLRDAAVKRGIIINGLAILNEEPTVDSYYFANVIGGTEAFVMTANDYEAYALAILTKLIKEIAGTPIAAHPSPVEASLAVAYGEPPARAPGEAPPPTNTGSALRPRQADGEIIQARKVSSIVFSPLSSPHPMGRMGPISLEVAWFSHHHRRGQVA